MSERLGLFTIIIFGEVIAQLISGVSSLHDLSFKIWLNFGLGVFVVFELWWIFFTLISDRRCKPGLNNSSFLELLYIPTLIGLGLLGMSFHGLFGHSTPLETHGLSYYQIFGFSLSLYLFGMFLMLYFLQFSEPFRNLKKRVQLTILAVSILELFLGLLNFELSLFYFLLLHFIVIFGAILVLNYQWYVVQAKKNKSAQS